MSVANIFKLPINSVAYELDPSSLKLVNIYVIWVNENVYFNFSILKYLSVKLSPLSIKGSKLVVSYPGNYNPFKSVSKRYDIEIISSRRDCY